MTSSLSPASFAGAMPSALQLSPTDQKKDTQMRVRQAQAGMLEREAAGNRMAGDPPGPFVGSSFIAVYEGQSLVAFGARFGAVSEANGSASVIEASMSLSLQHIGQQRPDLAQSGFSLVSSSGSLQVQSPGLDDNDASWLQLQFNRNSMLVDAVNAFNQHIVATWNDVSVTAPDGSTRRYSNLEATIDGAIDFKALIRSMAIAGGSGSGAEDQAQDLSQSPAYRALDYLAPTGISTSA